jgi:hypothetical protein
MVAGERLPHAIRRQPVGQSIFIEALLEHGPMEVS